MFILMHFRRPTNIGCLALMDNGRVFPRMRKTPSIMTESFPFTVMGSQAGLREQQSALRRLDGRRFQSPNFLSSSPPSHTCILSWSLLARDFYYYSKRTTYIKLICTKYLQYHNQYVSKDGTKKLDNWAFLEGHRS